MDKLWVDKYRPRKLEELNYHNDVSEVLSQLAAKNDFPHLLFYGPNGAGKKTRVLSFVNEVYGNGIYKLKCEERSFKIQNTSTTVECNVITSNYHIQITPSDNDHHDKHVIQRVLKQIASTQVIETKFNQKSFKIVIINEADRLTKEAQAALRRTMEKYISSCRIILVCEQLNRLITPIRSRCLNIRISAPNQQQISEVLEWVCKKQSLPLNPLVLEHLSRNCKGNLRSALLQLQVWKQLKIGNNLETLSQPWKKQIVSITKDIVTEQTPHKLKAIRQKFYDLLVNCLDGSFILKQMVGEFVAMKMSDSTLIQIIHHAAVCQYTMNLGSKPIYHLESFSAHCMLSIKEQKEKLNK